MEVPSNLCYWSFVALGIPNSALQGSGNGEGIVFLLGFQQVFCVAVLASALGTASPVLPVTSGTREESESILKIGCLSLLQQLF